MPSTAHPPKLWDTVKNDFKALFPDDVFKLWFEPIVCLEATEDALTLGVPNDFAAIWINDNYLEHIIQRLRLTAGHAVSVRLRKSGPDTRPITAGPAEPPPPPPPTSPPPPPAPVLERRGRNRPRNNPHTFETFVVGPNSQMAHAAALGVSHSPGNAHNPLFLYGATGLGKTHLMHAIGHAVLRNNPHARIAYLSTEKFTNEYVQGLQENSLTKFRQRYRSMDILLLDDVQFLTGKERIQEEFFHTFNDLFESGRQIVLSSDRPVGEIQKLEARLVSRFEWGMTADIQIPDFETRLAILRAKAATLKFDLPADVSNFIAQHISRNIRRLEGALLKVASFAALHHRPIDLAATEMLLQDVLMEQAQTILTIETIQKRVADHFQIRHSDMTSKRRPNNIAIPRQIAMYLARTLTKHSLQEIGDNFGGRDHGTVIHACKSVDNMMEQDAGMRNSIEFLRTQLSR